MTTPTPEPAPLPRPPGWHYLAADRLLRDADEEVRFAYAHLKVARAAVHAALAQCGDYIVDAEVVEDEDGYYPDDFKPIITTPTPKGDRL